MGTARSDYIYGDKKRWRQTPGFWLKGQWPLVQINALFGDIVCRASLTFVNFEERGFTYHRAKVHSSNNNAQTRFYGLVLFCWIASGRRSQETLCCRFQFLLFRPTDQQHRRVFPTKCRDILLISIDLRHTRTLKQSLCGSHSFVHSNCYYLDSWSLDHLSAGLNYCIC